MLGMQLDVGRRLSPRIGDKQRERDGNEMFGQIWNTALPRLSPNQTPVGAYYVLGKKAVEDFAW